MATIETEVNEKRLDIEKHLLKVLEDERRRSSSIGEIHVKSEPPEIVDEILQPPVEVKEEKPDYDCSSLDLLDPHFISVKREPSEDGDSVNAFPEEEDPLVPDPFAELEEKVMPGNTEESEKLSEVLITYTADGQRREITTTTTPKNGKTMEDIAAGVSTSGETLMTKISAKPSAMQPSTSTKLMASTTATMMPATSTQPTPDDLVTSNSSTQVPKNSVQSRKRNKKTEEESISTTAPMMLITPAKSRKTTTEDLVAADSSTVTPDDVISRKRKRILEEELRFKFEMKHREEVYELKTKILETEIQIQKIKAQTYMMQLEHEEQIVKLKSKYLDRKRDLLNKYGQWKWWKDW